MQGSIKNEFSVEFSSTKLEFLIEIFMDQIEPVVTEKYEFQKRHVSKLRNLFGKIWTIKFMAQRTESTVFQRNGLAQVENYRLRT